ncbi:hypothetical protein P9112_010840 [Eukaryota sp. TZLM1-RC]
MSSLTFFGHVTLDVKENHSNVSDSSDAILYQAGGGVFYGSIAAKTLGATTTVITRYNPNDSCIQNDFQQINHINNESSNTTTMKNVYLEGKANQRVSLCLCRADSFTPGDIPTTDSTSSCAVLSPLVNGEFPEHLIPLVAERFSTVALDVQGYTRCVEGQKMVQKDWLEKEEYLKYITILKVDEDEARTLTGCNDMSVSLPMIGKLGVQEVLCTHVEGVKLFVNGEIYESEWGNWDITARTGRGDTTLASYVVLRERYSDYQELLDMVAAVVTVKMNTPGPLRDVGSLARVLGREVDI